MSKTIRSQMTPSSPSPFRFFLNTVVLGLLLVVTSSSTLGASAACVDEFEPCSTDRDCCGRYNQGYLGVKCVEGHANQTDHGLTCKSKRSWALDQMSYDNEYDLHSVAFFLEFYFFSRPDIKKKYSGDREWEEIVDRQYFFDMAGNHTNKFAKLITTLEKEYNIKDLTEVPKLIRDFISWRDGVNIKALFEGKYDGHERIIMNYDKRGGHYDDGEDDDVEKRFESQDDQEMSAIAEGDGYNDNEENEL